MASAALALIVANSPLAPGYFAALSAYLGPLSVLHWINDGLMALFFLLVGLEIKRELLDGRLLEHTELRRDVRSPMHTSDVAQILGANLLRVLTDILQSHP